MPRRVQEPDRARAGGRSALVLSVVLLAAVGLAACGSSPTPPPSAQPASTSTAPASSQGAGATPAPAAPTAAPSGSTAPTVGGSGFDACALLTTAELSKILGDDRVPRPCRAADGSPGNVPGTGHRRASSSASARRPASRPTVMPRRQMRRPSRPVQAAGQRHRQARGRARRRGRRRAGGPNGIAAYQGDTYLQITNLGLTDDQLVKIAKQAVGRL